MIFPVILNKGETKQLFRDIEGAKISGVCAGFAHYFGIDVTIMRIIWLLGMLITGFFLMILLYIILALAMPKAKTTSDILKMKGKPIDFEHIKEESMRFANESGQKIGTFLQDNQPTILKAGSEIWNIVRKLLGGLFALFAYIGVSVMGCFAVYGMITAPSNTILRTIKQVKLDNKENIEFYKTIIRNPYYQKMDDSDKTAVYVLAFNGIVCADEGCLSNTGEPLLLHKNYALTYAIEKTLSAESVKLNKDFGKVTTLSDVAYKGLDGLSYNGISYEYEKAFKEFLEKTPKAVETIENAKQAYKNLEATYGSEWK